MSRFLFVIFITILIGFSSVFLFKDKLVLYYLNFEYESLSKSIDEKGFSKSLKILSDSENSKVLNKSQWSKFNFGDYLYLLPNTNIEYDLSPIFGQGEINKLIGFSYFKDDKKLFSFKSLPTSIFKKDISQNSFLKLPMIKDRVIKYRSEDLWEKIFSNNNLSRDNQDGLILKYYINYLRGRYIDPNMVNAQFFPKSKMAILSLENSIGIHETYKLMFLDNNIIHSFYIEVLPENIDSKYLFNSFRNNTYLQRGGVDISRIIYKEFSLMSFQNRSSLYGGLLLLSAWSQSNYRREFFKEAIKYIELSRSNTDFLKALYKYSYEKYGDNFSNKKERRQVLLRKRLEELADSELNKQKNDSNIDEGIAEPSLIDKLNNVKKPTKVDQIFMD